MFDIDQIWRK